MTTFSDPPLWKLPLGEVTSRSILPPACVVCPELTPKSLAPTVMQCELHIIYHKSRQRASYLQSPLKLVRERRVLQTSEARVQNRRRQIRDAKRRGWVVGQLLATLLIAFARSVVRPSIACDLQIPVLGQRGRAVGELQVNSKSEAEQIKGRAVAVGEGRGQCCCALEHAVGQDVGDSILGARGWQWAWKKLGLDYGDKVEALPVQAFVWSWDWVNVGAGNANKVLEL